MTADSVPAIAALPDVSSNRRLRLGPFCEEGLIVGYGDYGTNPGPLDLIAVDEDGTVSTLLAALPTEELSGFRVVDGGVLMPSIDPHGEAPGFIASNLGGEWRRIDVEIDGLPVVEHMFDVEIEGGVLLACGSHVPDTAFVWESTDGGLTWVEKIGNPSGEADGYNRFYGFRRDSLGQLVVDRVDSDGSFVRVDGTWEATDVKPPTVPLSRLVWINLNGQLVHHELGAIGYLPGLASAWSATLAADGATWLCDGDAIYRLPPPD